MGVGTDAGRRVVGWVQGPSMKGRWVWSWGLQRGKWVQMYIRDGKIAVVTN